MLLQVFLFAIFIKNIKQVFSAPLLQIGIWLRRETPQQPSSSFLMSLMNTYLPVKLLNKSSGH